MFTLGALLTAASLLMHAVQALWPSNDAVKTITKTVDTGAALGGGLAATTPRGQSDATPKVTTTTLPNGTVVRDHRA